jgi:predicted DNA-binding protein
MEKDKVRFTSYMRTELKEKLGELNEKTRVPISAYIDEAIEDLLNKYKKELER